MYSMPLVEKLIELKLKKAAKMVQAQQNGDVHTNGVIADEAFKNAGQTGGLQIWRIENMKVVPVPAKEHGKFYSGDAYILLHTSESAPRRWNVHFWLGSSSSQDEQGVAAYKTVELDNYLGGGPVQHREIQGHESKIFLSYFKKGIRLCSGGIASGLNKVDRDEYETRLFQVKGKRNCRITQVACSIDSVNKGDVFIVDNGKQIFVWIGPESGAVEKRKATDIARQIRDQDNNGRSTIEIIDDEWASHPTFYSLLGSHPGVILKSADQGGQDDDFEKRGNTELRFFRVSKNLLIRVSDASGKTELTEIDQRPLHKDMLDTNDCFILDLGSSGVFAWVGNGGTQNEKEQVWKMAHDFLRKRGYPKWTSVTRIHEGHEIAVFRQAFHWPQKALHKSDIESRVAHIDQEAMKQDVSTLHEKTISKAKDFMPDNGTGDAEVWRVENFYQVPVNRRDYGTFYSGDSYIILYKYHDTNKREQSIVYFWQGNHSTRDEKAAAAILAAKIDDKEMNGNAVQIRVVQNKEPAHFLKIFGDRLLVLMGGHGSGFRNVNSCDSYDIDGTRLFQVHDHRIVQVAERSASLNSNDVFVLETPHTTYMWLGTGASELEKKSSRDFAKMIVPLKNPTVLNEGEETDDFWLALGGKTPYASGRNLQVSSPSVAPRLFHCSNAKGYFHVEEIVDFSQEDLMEEDVMLLDTFDQVFVWIGKGANDIEKKEAMVTAMEYVRTDPLGRSVDDTVILTVKQGMEPPSFTGYFGAWDSDLWNGGLSYEQIKAQLGEENVKASKLSEELKKYSATYPLHVLMAKDLPEGVDGSKKEAHLLDCDFDRVLGMTRQSFDKLAPWKKIDLKKKVGLF